MYSLYPPYREYQNMEGYIGFCFFLCPVTDILATVAQISMKFLHDDTYWHQTDQGHTRKQCRRGAHLPFLER